MNSTAHAAHAHQFDSAAQQRQAVTLGMWLFLVTEVMFFGGLFCAYTLYRWRYPEAFVHASHELDVKLGAINTVILIGSSLTMALAVRGAQTGARRVQVAFLVLTIALGCAFLGIKSVEYGHKLEHGLFPGPSFRLPSAGAEAMHAELFTSFTS
ncbi:MAG: cytochrome c oxidase subunit 3 [Acidobacteriota bacterium]